MIAMRHPSERGSEVEPLRRLITLLTAETELIRLRRSLVRKYSPDQPRAPAGQTDGGRWVSDGSGGGGDQLIGRLPRGQGRWASLGGENDSNATTTE